MSKIQTKFKQNNIDRYANIFLCFDLFLFAIYCSTDSFYIIVDIIIFVLYALQDLTLIKNKVIQFH